MLCLLLWGVVLMQWTKQMFWPSLSQNVTNIFKVRKRQHVEVSVANFWGANETLSKHKQDANGRAALELWSVWCISVTLIAILSTAWAQHLAAINVASEHNSPCIWILIEFFWSVLVEFWTHRHDFRRKSLTLVLGNHSTLYFWNCTPSTIYMYILETLINISRRFRNRNVVMQIYEKWISTTRCNFNTAGHHSKR
jgi:hypothetical protein